ncbi:hypothetical protein NWP13_20575 [Rhodococcus pyridinivorans]|nr:hypothetical protein [Rhodococcus pyridinivorans]
MEEARRGERWSRHPGGRDEFAATSIRIVRAICRAQHGRDDDTALPQRRIGEP